jgi:alkyl sulfatase BDS1-like metallo-beta-lactamase superfamily hydrolase
MREVRLPDSLYVGQGYGKVSWSVRSFWEGYMGWFKGDHTSDLYAKPPHGVFPDLVELAGVDAVVARGRDKLAGGDLESATLLSEAALESSPGHAGALELSLQAHRALLERSDRRNFWEVGWLKHRIGALETGRPLR